MKKPAQFRGLFHYGRATGDLLRRSLTRAQRGVKRAARAANAQLGHCQAPPMQNARPPAPGVLLLDQDARLHRCLSEQRESGTSNAKRPATSAGRFASPRHQRPGTRRAREAGRRPPTARNPRVVPPHSSDDSPTRVAHRQASISRPHPFGR